MGSVGEGVSECVERMSERDWLIFVFLFSHKLTLNILPAVTK